MSDLTLQSITQVDLAFLTPLMDEEEQSWLSELDWDYAPIRKIISSFMGQKLLPGYVAASGGRACGYTYFLIQHNKGIIGTAYANGVDAQKVADRVLTEAVGWLKGSPNITRIEAQLFPLNGLHLTPIFLHHGFHHHVRNYLELEMSDVTRRETPACAEKIIPWDSSYLSQAAQVTLSGYSGGLDALICEDYCSQGGCESYLRSLIDNPGCGIFLPEASFIGLDRHGVACGFVMSSRISSTSAMIPQISIHPSHQGQHLGRALIDRALASIRVLGFPTVRLTVTEENLRAYEWYRRLGFRSRKEFGAYIWQRT